MKTAYIYLRVASIKQVDDQSLENQKRICLQYAKSQGYQVKDIFIDKGESAINRNRVGLQRLYKAIEADPPTAVICTSIDRMFRNITDFSKTRNQFKKLGIKLVAVRNGGDLTFGLIGDIFAAVAQFESEVANE